MTFEVAWCEFDTPRGEYLANTHWRTRFTCPSCLEEHTVEGIFGHDPKRIRCKCGAPLKLTVQMVPEAVCTIMDADEEEEYLRPEAEQLLPAEYTAQAQVPAIMLMSLNREIGLAA